MNSEALQKQLEEVFSKPPEDIIQIRQSILQQYSVGLKTNDPIGIVIKEFITIAESSRRRIKNRANRRPTTSEFKTGVAAVDKKVTSKKTTKKIVEKQTEEGTYVPRWGKREELLYHDIVHLFSISDHNGALISFERLLILADGTDEFEDFMKKNQGKIYDIYEKYFVSLDRIPAPLALNNMKAPIPEYNQQLVNRILKLANGKRTIGEIFVQANTISPVKILAILSHLIRSGYLDLT